MNKGNSKVLIVTGATSGMGRAVALGAAAAGYTVVATGRDANRMARLEKDAADRGTELDVRFLEITDHPAVAALVADVAEAHGRLDAVVSQAGGIYTLGTAEQITMDGYRYVMERNFFGNLAVIKAALPHLRASRGRLIVTTSANGLVGAPYNDAYAASKFALEGAVESLAPVVARYGVKTTMVEPGPVATDLVAAHRFDRLLPNEHLDDSPYPQPWELLSRIIAGAGASAMQPAEEVGEQILDLLTQENPPLRFQTTPWTTDFVAPKMSGDLDGRKVLAAGEAYLALAD
ncbi:SDR family NAD(P)-dependent oxidoreductase [Amycolatopsis rhabdoformis]|uniref:SDR family NAD(P)-dependent oxidoreductase n=1 Tax=Amycolatopsis rhabdoformis TaxID=1448059 RepID=A0ABZ1HWM7_9PSEU|nr:SDR family NAD(P)-dependent oxidoreductase [Amycolatopsis rhabdoformis]WSE26548.1 SDR family NAD(P)-dependent oxidoreductase [Amycolatopsis rhabdoformis]